MDVHLQLNEVSLNCTLCQHSLLVHAVCTCLSLGRGGEGVLVGLGWSEVGWGGLIWGWS